MKQLNIAILEDSPILLKDLIGYIEDLKLANIKVKAQNTTDFLEKLNEASTIDAVVLDIDIHGDSMNGIDVANHLKLPTLFISGKTKNYLNEIEDLRLFHDQPVEFLTKPIRDDKLKLVFEKFVEQIKSHEKSNFFEVKLHNGVTEKIKQCDIVYITSVPNSKKNSKNIFTKNQETPFEVSKINMDEFFERGLSKEKFTKTHQSFIINLDYFDLNGLKRGESTFEIKYFVENKELKEKISLSREYLQNIRKS